MKIFKALFFLLIIAASFLFPSNAIADEESQFITIVNPVRISRYTNNPKETIDAQYQIIANNNLPATWLLTFDALNNEGINSVVATMDDKQELGLFLEITPSLAEAAGVEYNDTGFWHHATSVFLSGYTQEERLKLIDTVFEKFKDKFGLYPTSVGSWWTDSYSLAYMKEKYGITANLGCADQFSTDGYQIWGQYWSTPYYPSKYHAAIPAPSLDTKLDIVTTQWAARDPLNGYKSSLYSTQDYFVTPERLEIDYFEKLVKLYAGKNNNLFGQITVGLESDLDAGAYSGHFSNQIKTVKKLSESNEYEVVNMKEFSNWYRKEFPDLSPSHIIESNDLLDKADNKVIWYQSPRYRLGISYNNKAHETKIFDFRSYHADFQEPYYQSPNREFELSIYIPSYFDEINNKGDVWKIDLGKFVRRDESKLFFEEGKVSLSPQTIIVEGKNVETPEILKTSSALNIISSNKTVEIHVEENWISDRDGFVFKALTLEATHFLRGKKIGLILSGFLMILVFIVVKLLRSKVNIKKNILKAMLIAALAVVFIFSWYLKNTTSYFISQGELDALFRLSNLPGGRVVVYDNECLQCSYHTQLKPAVFANKRDYVRKLGGHPIVYNSSVFEARDQSQAKEEFEKLNAKYIYLVKYEDYIEKTPFSPGDLGIEKIYDNANAEIWRVKKGD